MNRFVFFLPVLFNICMAQDRAKIDSMLSVIQKPSQVCTGKCITDTVVLNAYLHLGAKMYDDVPDTALYYLDKTLEQANRILKTQSPKNLLYDLVQLKKTTALNEKGWTYYALGTYNKSMLYFEQSMKITAKYTSHQNHSLQFKAKKIQLYNYGGLGVAYTAKTDYPKALGHCFAALKLAEEIGNKTGQAANLGNIGNIYSAQGEYNKALEYHLKALPLNQQTGNRSGEAINLGNIGIAYDYLGNSTKALEYYFKALAINQEMGNTGDQAIDLASIAGLYSFKQDYQKALEYYFKALELNKSINSKQGETNVTGNIGLVYIKMKQYQPAEKYLLQFMQLATELRSLYEIQYAHEYLSMLYAETGRYEKALKVYKISIQYRDSITNEENTRASLEKEVQFHYDKKAAADSVANAKAQEIKNAELARKNAELKAKRNQQYALFGGLFLVLVFAGFMYNRFRVTSRQKRIIEQKERETQQQNEIIVMQKQMVEEKHKEITDSIHYAERIQRSFLATKDMLDENLKDYFVLFQPKEAVSGDFYWATTMFERSAFDSSNVQTIKPSNNPTFYLAVCDSTGHGVPGAIMSLLNISSLEKAVEKYHEPNEILNETRKTIIERLKKDGSAEGGKDGMDAALLRFDMDQKQLVFSLANNPLWLIRAGEVKEFAPDRMPVGKHDKQDILFTNHEITLQKNDLIFVFTDGYADQFGGDKGKKFKYANLQKLLLQHAHLPMLEQYRMLGEEFERWKGNLEQIDDVCIMGIRIG